MVHSSSRCGCGGRGPLANPTTFLRGRVVAILAFALLGATESALGQAPPAPGAILKDVERSLPKREMTAPDGARVEIPDAPAMGASPDQRVTVEGYRITGNTIFDEEKLLRVISDSTGVLTLQQLHEVAARVTNYYRERGYLVARAYLPEQQIEDGVVIIAVLEGRFDQTAIQDQTRVSQRRVWRTLNRALCGNGEQCRGALISSRPLERGVLLLNDIPGVQAGARLIPGEQVGTSTLLVNAVADPLVGGVLQVDNGGSYYTGQARAVGSMWLNSPLGLADQLTVQGVVTDVHGNLFYGALGYSLPVGYTGARFEVRGSYMKYELGDLYKPLDASGTVKGGDAILSYPFVRSRAANVSASLAYGERRFSDEASAVGTSAEREIRDRAEASLNAGFRDSLFGVPGFNTFAVDYVRGEVDLDDALALTDAVTAQTEGSYGKWTFDYSRLQPMFGRTSLFVRTSVQLASENLDSYEKFALGGPGSVRAYPVGEMLVDEGVLYSVELRQGFGSPAQWLDGLEVSLFHDRARGDRSKDPWFETPNRASLSGTGIGLGCTIANRVSFRATVARRGDDPMTAAPDSRTHYNASMSMAF